MRAARWVVWPTAGVVHAEIAPDRAHDHLAGIEADADLDLDAVVPANLGRVAADGLLHGERGVAGADGVILVSQRRAEQRHDAIAHDLVDGALVTVHRLHHAVEDGVQQLARLFRVAVGEQLEGAFHVGEEHRDLLALPLERMARGEDLLGQVAGRVAVGRRERRRCGRRRRTGLPHSLQKRLPGRLKCPHAGQTSLQTPAAVAAELRAGGVILPALGAAHVGSISRRHRSSATAIRLGSQGRKTDER